MEEEGEICTEDRIENNNDILYPICLISLTDYPAEILRAKRFRKSQ